MGDFAGKRYIVQAKRKSANEDWSEWTQADSYKRATEHARKVEELGHLSRIVPSQSAERLLTILNDTEKADEILDAGFRLQSEVVKDVFSSINYALDKLFRQNEIAMETHKTHERTDSVIHCLSKKMAFESVKEAMSKVEKRYTKGAKK